MENETSLPIIQLCRYTFGAPAIRTLVDEINSEL